MSDTVELEYGIIDAGVWVGCVWRDAVTGNAQSICTHWCVYPTAFRADLLGKNSMLLMWYTRNDGWRIEEWAKHSCGE
jgi:hypothetical protein